MKTDNELIAEFLGGYTKVGEGLHRFEDKNGNVNVAEHLEFHTSWDWLMPVVEKINKTQPSAFRWSFEEGPLSPLAKVRINDPISDVYKAVIEFIRWYNSTSTTKPIEK